MLALLMHARKWRRCEGAGNCSEMLSVHMPMPMRGNEDAHHAVEYALEPHTHNGGVVLPGINRCAP